jgi:Na+/melibiose symporter-like transporter
MEKFRKKKEKEDEGWAHTNVAVRFGMIMMMMMKRCFKKNREALVFNQLVLKEKITKPSIPKQTKKEKKNQQNNKRNNNPPPQKKV